ncbi:hypothetical protein ACWGJP_07350 [Microbacterium sp. NPDC055903]
MEIVLLMGLVILIGLVLLGGAGLILLLLRNPRRGGDRDRTPAVVPSAPPSAPAIAPSAPATTAVPIAVSEFTGNTGQISEQVSAEIERLLASGNPIEAIKAYREETGVGLQEAKKRIDHWRSNAAELPASLPALGDVLPADVLGEIAQHLAAGRKIEAIKLLRERADVGLKEAKDAIEAFADGMP